MPYGRQSDNFKIAPGEKYRGPCRAGDIAVKKQIAFPAKRMIQCDTDQSLDVLPRYACPSSSDRHDR